MKYRYHWLFKLLALVLAAVSGAAALIGCSGLILDDLGYYERSRRSQLFNNIFQKYYTIFLFNTSFSSSKATGRQPLLI